MGKTQVLSALTFAMVATMISGGVAFAQEDAGIATQSSSASTSVSASDISTLQSQVRDASAKNKDNKEYPGLSHYLDGLANGHTESKDINQEYADAMSEAVKAANLLAGRDLGASNQTPNSNTRTIFNNDIDSSTNTIATSQTVVPATQTTESTAPAKVATTSTAAATGAVVKVNAIPSAEPTAKLATAIKVVVANSERESNAVAVKNFSDDGTVVDDELTNKDETPAPEVIPELPKTGEVKSNLGILVVAGVAVAVVVLGATATILKVKGKKSNE